MTKKWAEIDRDSRVRAFLTIEDDTFVPQIAPPMQYVEVDVDGAEEEGDYYDPNKDSFSKTEPSQATFEYYSKLLEEERAKLFEKYKWVRERHADKVEQGIDDSAEYEPWLAFWQALRDMPKQPDFNVMNPAWPEPPE